MAELISTFKERFSKAMSIRTITPTELKDKTGISLATISQYTSGYSKPKTERTNLIANALSVDPAWLMGFDVPMERNDYEFRDTSGKAHLSFDNVEDFKKAYDKSKFRGDRLMTAIIDNAEKLDNVGKKSLLDYSYFLLDKSDHLTVKAAHERTDIEATEEMRQHDDDIMNDDSEWE